MRIAITADNNQGLDSPVSMHFGQSRYFLLVDVEGTQVAGVNAVANPYYGNHSCGQLADFVRSQGAHILLTGGMGLRAADSFRQCQIEPISGASGSARQALEQYLSGQLRGVQPCTESHHQHGCGH